MAQFQYYTAEAVEKLKTELHSLKFQGRQDMAKQIAEARDKGDLSENAEYDAAKDAQGLLELKISKLEQVVANARVLDELIEFYNPNLIRWDFLYFSFYEY